MTQARFSNLPDYAFMRLRRLVDGIEPGADPIVMTIGEPQHAPPDWVGDEIAKSLDGFRKYPPNDGTPELRAAIAGFLHRRYGANIDADTQILPLNGTREGLFNACLALCPDTKSNQRPVVLMPNPFYQVYAAAALSVGAEPVYVPADETTGNLPDLSAIPASVLNRAAVAYICSPANPQGAVADHAYWAQVIGLAQTYGFKVFADECYSEIYRTTPPPGAIEVAQDIGADRETVLSFHSLSKRSNLAGLRSGFVAGGPHSIAAMKKLRAYGGAPLPLPIQAVSTRAWADDVHVAENRALYHQKYEIADQVLADVPFYDPPQAGFFLWLKVDNGQDAARRLWREVGVKVLPGAYLSRQIGDKITCHDRIRVAMVAPADDIKAGLLRLKSCLYQ